jgi:2-polyprenyl-3-methyl-5-hydroxy-6-metoxy-1,4-benzoquinol methylase
MLEAARIYGGRFDIDDRNNPRTIIAGWVPDGSSVLEVGPGDGVISGWLRQAKGCRTVGLELAPAAGEAAREAFVQLIIGTVESDRVIEQLRAHGPFDAIILADVLEHLVDPWGVLRKLGPLLAPAGSVLISVPNIAHWSARLNLLVGRFDYADGYLMDRNHLRWFTRRSAKEMAGWAGYRVVEEKIVYKPRFARILPNVNGFQTVLKLAPVE